MRRDAARVVLASAAGGLLAAAIVVPVGGSASPSRSPLATNLSRASAPRCFGAASRDPEHPCRNRALRLSVVPTPGIAQITPNEPCTQVQVAPDVCVLGATPEQATATVALVGDSHAEHWRAALATIARSRGWR